jgi:DNA-binding MarR family transcriptional regulator
LHNDSDNDNEKHNHNHHHINIPDNRSRIYDYIKNKPGSHLRKINKELTLAMGDTQYHLRNLEKSGVVKSKRIGIYKVYYTVSILEGREESILSTLQQDTPREIVIHILEHAGATQSEIADHMGFSSPTINWHMSNLIEIGLVRAQKDRHFVKYYIKGDIKDITSLLKLYYPTIWSKLSSRLADLFLDLSTASRSYSVGVANEDITINRKKQVIEKEEYEDQDNNEDKHKKIGEQ